MGGGRRAAALPAVMTALIVFVCTLVGGVLTGCGGGDASGPTITVFAASSLSGAFEDLASAYERDHPDAAITLNLAGSAALREQILEGAPADVFASANPDAVLTLVEAGEVVGTPTGFARNRVVIGVPAGNPAGVDGLDAFADASLLVGLCVASAPCGIYADHAFERAGVEPAVDTREPDALALYTKVAEGELDAALIYESDLWRDPEAVEAIALPAGVFIEATYLMAAVGTDIGAPFIEFVTSETGQSVLRSHGFRVDQ